MTNPYDPNNPYQQYPPQQGAPQQGPYQPNPYSQAPAPQPQPPYPGYGMYPQPPPNNGLAIASMVVSLVSLLVCQLGIVLGPIGLILGHVALRKLKEQPAQRGRGMALAGVIIGWIVLAIWVGVILFVVLAATGTLGPELQSEFE
ncbi:DUF4190 domain-containing protein [Saccharopolyspora gloriosae]|uniref:DUF4190 domain-containing protein n=1 Tax=Saccharopolyspora gloriosae TaxID=455344 RepID=UPI001FB7C003|nr:DUF4190 domain-containing protein [Saccharopolyspora gloriosae]